MKKYAYSIIEGHVTIGGETHPVSSFRLNLTHNGIPSLRLNLDPVHTGDGSSASKSDGDAFPAVLPAFLEKYNALGELIEAKQGRECTFTFSMQSADGDNQELILKDWLLVGIGFHGASVAGALQLSLDLHHPVRKLSEGNIHMPGSDKDKEWHKSLLHTADNVYDAVIAALKHYMDTVPHEAPQLWQDELKERVGGMIEAMSDCLVWDDDAEGWPSAPFSTRLKDCIPNAVAAYVASIQGVAPWNWLVQTFMSDWSVSMRTHYWTEKMILTPYTPWEEAKMTISDTDVSDFKLPSVDPAPIAGVMMLMDNQSMWNYTAGTWPSGMQKMLTDGSAHIENTLPGPIHHVGVPRWVWQVPVDSNGSGSSYTGGNYKNNGLNVSQLSNESDIKRGEANDAVITDLTETGKGLELFCKQQFTEIYRRGTGASLRCRLMLNAEGGIDKQYITPGYVCQVEHDPDAAEEAGLSSVKDAGTLVKFFVTHVAHVVDCDRHVAETVISGQYVHRDAGPKLKAIEEGVAANYLYTPAGE